MSCRNPEAIGSWGSSARCREKMKQDEDLLLFSEMFKREKERNLCLLQPESVELEPGQETYLLHKIPSWKRELLVTGSSKNDYDWLKTPPATPLFPSLEMEANQPNMVLHREIPPLHPFKPSRFKGKPEEEPKPVTSKSSSPRSASSSQPTTPKGTGGRRVSMAKPKQATSTDASVKTATIARSKTPRPVNPANNTTTLERSRTPPQLNPVKVSVTTGVAKFESGNPRTQSESSRDGKQQVVAVKGRSSASKEPVAGEKVMKDSKKKDVNGVWKLNMGFGKFKSRDSHDSAHKCMGDKNAPAHANHQNGGHTNNSQPARTLPGANSSHQTPQRDAKNSGGHIAKHVPKAGTFFRRAKIE